MLQAGGYWRPLAAVARLLEELGELTELLAGRASPCGGTPPREELAGELADLWIITTALADQYLASVPEPASAGREDATALALVTAAGPIGRVVNHYDGPKTPRAGSAMPSLGEAIAAFHAELGGLAGALEVDLADAVADKLATIRARGDLTRFARSGHDPSTAAVLGRYRAAAQRQRAGDGEARLWGGPEWAQGGVGANAPAISPWLTAFAKAARPERLEGFLIAGPPLASRRQRESWAAELLGELGARAEDAPAGLVREGLRMSARLAEEPQRQAEGPRRGAEGPQRQAEEPQREAEGPQRETFLLLVPAAG